MNPNMYGQYSAAYYAAPLPPAAQQYAYVQYPPVYYQPVPPPIHHSPGKPKKVHRYNAPPPTVNLNPFLDAENRGTKDLLVWDVSHPWEDARRFISGSKISGLSERHFEQPATNPPVPIMWIIYKDTDSRLKVKGGPGGVTVAHVLQAIFIGLRAELDEDEWLDKNEDDRILIHENRCARLGREPANFEIDSQVRKIDALFDKTIFLGLKQLGSPEQYEWELKLARPKPKEEKGKGKALWTW